MEPAEIKRVLSNKPYIAEDINGNLIVDKIYFNLGILVDVNRIQEKNIVLSASDEKRVRKMLDETGLKYMRAPQVNAIYFMGDYIEEIKCKNRGLDINIIKHFDDFIALLYPNETFDHYVFIR